MGGKHTSETGRASVIIWPKLLELLLMSDSRKDVVKALRAVERNDVCTQRRPPIVDTENTTDHG